MFNIFKNKKIKKERDSLLLKNANLIIELERYSKVDRLLAKIVEEKLDLEDLDLSTDGEKKKVAIKAREALNNPVLKSILNNNRYKLIMGGIKESRDYPELVQKRANLLFIEISILKELGNLSTIDEKPDKPSIEENPDLSFVNN